MNSSEVNSIPEEIINDIPDQSSEIIRGGYLAFESTVNFDSLLYSREFQNLVGDKITISLNTSSTGIDNPSNTYYRIEHQSFLNGQWVTNGFAEPSNNGPETYTIGGYSVGERLRLKFTDTADGEFITGSIKVYD